MSEAPQSCMYTCISWLSTAQRRHGPRTEHPRERGRLQPRMRRRVARTSCFRVAQHPLVRDADRVLEHAEHGVAETSWKGALGDEGEVHPHTPCARSMIPRISLAMRAMIGAMSSSVRLQQREAYLDVQPRQHACTHAIL